MPGWEQIKKTIDMINIQLKSIKGTLSADMLGYLSFAKFVCSCSLIGQELIVLQNSNIKIIFY